MNLQATVLDALGPKVSRGIANAGTATLAQLMNHTSGIPSWEDDQRWIHDARGDRINPSHVWGEAETLNYIRGHPALFPPGERYSYSNTNYTLLGLAIGRATGRELAVEIRERICIPIGLRHTFLDGFLPEPDRHDAAACTSLSLRYPPCSEETAGLPPTAHDAGNGLIDVTATNLSCEWAAGGLVSTSIDLVRFFLALPRWALLGPTSMAFAQVWRQAGRLPSGVPFFVGHGLFRQQVGERWLIGHTGVAYSVRRRARSGSKVRTWSLRS